MDVEGHFGFEMQAHTIKQMAFLLGTPVPNDNELVHFGPSARPDRPQL